MKTDRLLRAMQLMQFDREYKKTGLVVAGMDEAGRGPLAGNVVAACVIMPETPVLAWVDDSKKLSETRRELVCQEIYKTALYIGIGEASPDEIDRINILEATKNAMRKAASHIPADIFLIDAVKNLGLGRKEIPIIKGDALSYSIAAASIIAKVTRDREMRELDEKYPEYGFARHKGYGTKEHIEAIRVHGLIPEHRKSFTGHFI